MIRWGIIGLGNIALRFTKSIQNSKNGKIVAIASHNPKKQQQFQKLIDNVDIYDDYHQLITSKKIDALYVALPHGMHYEWCKKALQNKIHVLCEKPSTLSVQETNELVQLSKDNHLLFMEALKTRFIDFNDVIKKDINDGMIGKIHLAKAYFCHDVTQSQRKIGWYLFDQQQGGALYDVGPYPISFIMDFLGKEYLSLTSELCYLDGVDHCFKATIKYSHHIQGIIEGAIDKNKERIGYLYGEKGYMEIPMYNRPTEYTVYLNNGDIIHKKQPLPYDDMYDEIEAAHQCITKHQIEAKNWNHDDSLTMMKIIEDIKQ